MNSRYARFLGIGAAFCLVAITACAAAAASASSAFIAVPFGHAVSAWYPTDINNDNLWELAITFNGPPAQAGIFSPSTLTWLDGPHELPVTGTNWGAGDYLDNGSIAYPYLKADTIFLHREGISPDSMLWVAPFWPLNATFWGESSDGRFLVGLNETVHFHSEDSTYPDYPHIYDSYAWTMHVFDLFTGEQQHQFPAGVTPARRVSGVTAGMDNRMVLHEHHMTVDQYFFVQAFYTDAIFLVDSDWNRTPILQLGAQYGSAGSPPDPALLRHVAVDPTGPRLVVDLLTDRGLRPCRISSQNVNTAAAVWSRSFPTPYYMNFAVFDLHEDGHPALYLPLLSGAGWEVRTMSTGAITDTLPGMPKADLQTGHILTADHQDLFYIADSSLYIWGMPTSVSDNQSNTTAVPKSPTLTAYPNPFNSTVLLGWSNAGGASTLEILNILGQCVRTYEINAERTTSIQWDGRDSQGRPVPSGMYFVCFPGSSQLPAKKLVLLK